MQSKTPTKAQYQVTIIGGGSWGTALAIAANRAGSRVKLVTRNKNVRDAISETRTNDIYLPGIFIDPAIEISDNMADAGSSDVVLLAMPSYCVRYACINISDFIQPSIPVIIGSKGLERGSLLMMTEVVTSVLNGNVVAVLSGPNFAEEVALGKPTATTIACANAEVANWIIYALGSKYFRPYYTDDVIGTQIGGAMKNVIAIATGIAASRDLGENARAAIITRGFSEMARLALACGGRLETLSGLSGMGDLVLTCASPTSRNMSLGMALGQGASAEDVVAGEGRTVLEGAVTAESIVKLAEKHKVAVPISQAVHGVLANQMSVDVAIDQLLERPFAPEWAAA